MGTVFLFCCRRCHLLLDLMGRTCEERLRRAYRKLRESWPSRTAVLNSDFARLKTAVVSEKEKLSGGPRE